MSYTKLMLDINFEIRKIYVRFCQMCSGNGWDPSSQSKFDA